MYVLNPAETVLEKNVLMVAVTIVMANARAMVTVLTEAETGAVMHPEATADQVNVRAMDQDRTNVKVTATVLKEVVMQKGPAIAETVPVSAKATATVQIKLLLLKKHPANPEIEKIIFQGRNVRENHFNILPLQMERRVR